MKRNLWRLLSLTCILAMALVFVGGPRPVQAVLPVNEAQPALSEQDIPGWLAKAGIPLENIRPYEPESFQSDSILSDSQATSSDPTYRWHTFYGEPGEWDEGIGIAVDVTGIYITGFITAAWDGPSGQAPLHAYSGGLNFVVLKLDLSGAYLWHTFYGGGYDEGSKVAVDANGVYVIGDSYNEWYGPTGQYPLHEHSGGGYSWDLTVLRLDLNGAYQWHTFYGSSSSDYASDVVINSGGVYVVGRSNAAWGGPSGQAPLRPYSGDFDITVLKLNANGDYQWHAFYGSTGVDSMGKIAVSGNSVLITGRSDTAWTGPVGQAPLHAHSGDFDIVVIRLNDAGAYQWHTFYGSAAYDTGYGVATDGAGVWITGQSQGTWTGPAGQVPLHPYAGARDMIILKLDANGAYQWHTFYGGELSDEIGAGIVLNGGGVYITGVGGSSWMGPAGQAPLHEFSGNSDFLVLKLEAGGVYQWHTFFGSTLRDTANGIAIGPDGVYIAGVSIASWNGPAGQSPLHVHRGAEEITALKLDANGGYQWHTFHGALCVSQGNSIAAGDGGIYIAGSSDYAWVGPDGQAPLHAFSFSDDFVIIKLDNNGNYLWHTFYGGYYEDYAQGIVVDATGVYIVGESWWYEWTGPADQAPLHAHNGYIDIAVLKLDHDGAYQWHTFYGGSDLNRGYGIAVRENGLYITGQSALSWNGPANQAPLHAFTGGSSYDIVMLKLNTAGAYQWHTFYPGSGSTVAIDDSGVYIAGYSLFSWTGPAGQVPLHAYTADYDIVVLKLDLNGGYLWHTFYGTPAFDSGYSIAIYNEGVLITGASSGSWVGPAGQAPLHGYTGGQDITVIKLNSSGAYQWHTFYGSSADDSGFGILVSRSGVYVTGISGSQWTGPADQAPMHAYSGSSDLYVLKLDTAGSYQWHTFYGSSNFDAGMAITENPTGIYVVGDSTAAWNGSSLQSPLHPYSCGWNIFVLKLNPLFRPIYIPITYKN